MEIQDNDPIPGDKTVKKKKKKEIYAISVTGCCCRVRISLLLRTGRGKLTGRSA
jgi:hypothetical protein